MINFRTSNSFLILVFLILIIFVIASCVPEEITKKDSYEKSVIKPAQTMCVIDCKIQGEKICLGSIYQECLLSSDGCLKLGPPTQCPEGESCQNGNCIEQGEITQPENETLGQKLCTDTCSKIGERACSNLGYYIACEQSVTGCLEWKLIEKCPSNTVCTNEGCIPIGPINCESDYDCFIEASKNCKSAKMTRTASVDVFGLVQTTTSTLEIKDLEANKCILYMITEKNDIKISDWLRQQMVANNNTEEQIVQLEQEANNEADKTEGYDGTCKFNIDDLTALLKRWKAGDVSSNDFSVAECSGKLFEQP